MMLVAPKSSIWRWACRLMPSPIATSQITLATPMKIPSTVKRDRSGCTKRLLMPSCQVRSQRKGMRKGTGNRGIGNGEFDEPRGRVVVG
jgi:hypothetical protein